MREVILYGLPLWIGIPIIAWYFDGWLGLTSAVVGLLILAIYTGSTVIIASKTPKRSTKVAVALAVVGFWARLFGLWLLIFILSQVLELNLLVVLLTVAFGFTAVLLLSIKNWL